MSGIKFPGEWYPQSAVQVTWPHLNTDWADDLEEVTACYIALSKEILKREKLLVVCNDAVEVKRHFSKEEQQNLLCVTAESNDTWARDHGGISLFINNRPAIADFGFNGWGLKFAANHDNLITAKLFKKAVFQPEVLLRNNLDFILEGGSIESDGNGTILTTARCLLAPNRNQPMGREEIEEFLMQNLGAARVLWLHHGYLAGDDTDSHIDTLARFCDEQTIAYVKCDDPEDEHFTELSKMEKEIESLITRDGKPYRLIPLPMADAVWQNYERSQAIGADQQNCDRLPGTETGWLKRERLPATYANFLIINGAVLIPFYGTEKDQIAMKQLRKAFPGRELVGVDCRPLIKQHGSLHCVTMQYPLGFL